MECCCQCYFTRSKQYDTTFFIYHGKGIIRDGPLNLLIYGIFGKNCVFRIVNLGIDSPLIGTSLDKRPMWRWIIENDNYLKHYHDILDELIREYFESGEFEKEFNSMYEMLLPYVEKDPTAFYTVEDYMNGSEVLKQICGLRADSIRAQLDGKLSTDSLTQSKSDRVDASAIDILKMGAFVTGE